MARIKTINLLGIVCASKRANLPPTYAPIHIKPACPKLSSPKKPTTRFRETARMMLKPICVKSVAYDISRFPVKYIPKPMPSKTSTNR